MARGGLTPFGIALTAFSAYLAVGLVTFYRDVSADPLVVAQLGPGLAVVAAGRLLVLATSFIGEGSDRHQWPKRVHRPTSIRHMLDAHCRIGEVGGLDAHGRVS